jgi:histidinol dehydrogenase
MARVRGGLSALDFVKLVTVQEYTAQGISVLGPRAALLADAEGLTAHAAAVRMRVRKASRRRPAVARRRRSNG